MRESGRKRSALVVAPIVFALLFLTWAGLFCPWTVL